MEFTLIYMKFISAESKRKGIFGYFKYLYYTYKAIEEFKAYKKACLKNSPYKTEYNLHAVLDGFFRFISGQMMQSENTNYLYHTPLYDMTVSFCKNVGMIKFDLRDIITKELAAEFGVTSTGEINAKIDHANGNIECKIINYHDDGTEHANVFTIHNQEDKEIMALNKLYVKNTLLHLIFLTYGNILSKGGKLV